VHTHVGRQQEDPKDQAGLREAPIRLFAHAVSPRRARSGALGECSSLRILHLFYRLLTRSNR